MCDKFEGRLIPAEVPNLHNYLKWEPFGVVAQILPWNSPIGTLIWKLAPCLAAGNTVVLKVEGSEIMVLREMCGGVMFAQPRGLRIQENQRYAWDTAGYNEKEIIENSITELLFNKTYYKITTEVLKFKAFYLAEEYHQDYKKKNPYNPYILNVSAPRINKFKIDYSELLK